MGVPTKMSLFMIGDFGLLSVYDIFLFFFKIFMGNEPLNLNPFDFIVTKIRGSNHQFFGSPKQEKSSVSSAIMLLGAAFRPLYVSFLPGAAASLGRWSKDTGTSKATFHAMQHILLLAGYGFDWMVIGLDVFVWGVLWW